MSAMASLIARAGRIRSMPIAAKPLTPAPMPSTQRPPDISSTDAAAVAVRAG